MPISAVDLPFREQAEFLRRKRNINTESWIDIYNDEHDWAFVVAGANRDAIVSDFRRAIEKVIDEGMTLEDFRKEFDAIVERNGWSYKGGRNWRSRVIYETNLNSSYQAGRYEQLMAVRDRRPYWQYIHNDSVEHPRPHHVSWNGLILRWDDPWWQTHFPPGGWGCQCRVMALSDADLQRMGRTVDKAPEIVWVDKEIGQRSPGGPLTVRVPEGIDPSFEHIPGQSRMDGATPPAAPLPPPPPQTPPPPAPPPLPAPPRLPTNIGVDDAARAFLESFGAADEPVIFRDVLNNPIVIGPSMMLRINIRVREFMNALAVALQSPREIYVRTQWDEKLQRAFVRRSYVAQMEDDAGRYTVAVDMGRDGWWAEVGDAAENYRQGELIYRETEQ
jgi:Uncharacterized protein, homolog of phage Mu protein gp30